MTEMIIPFLFKLMSEIMKFVVYQKFYVPKILWKMFGSDSIWKLKTKQGAWYATQFPWKWK